MAERMDESDHGFLGAQPTEHMNNSPTIPLPSDVSTPPSDQLEVNAIAVNQAGGPPVMPVLKVMTPVECLNEICVVRKLSIPQYESKGESGVAHMKKFTMEVWVHDMNLRETGHSKKKRDAKHEAASRVLDKLHAAGERNEGLGRLTPEIVKKCHEMLQKCVLPQSEAESVTAHTQEGEEVRPKTLIRALGPCPVCLAPRIRKKMRAELACGHCFCRRCVHLWAQHLIIHNNTQIYCMELSCGVGFTSFWTHTGIHYVFSAEKGFVRVTTTKRVMTQEERFRERLQRRVDQENDE